MTNICYLLAMRVPLYENNKILAINASVLRFPLCWGHLILALQLRVLLKCNLIILLMTELP